MHTKELLRHSTRGSRAAALLPVLTGILLAMPVTAAAQIIQPRPPVREPSAWTSIGVGLMQSNVITDWPSSTEWDFGTMFPWRASIESRISGGTTAGVSAAISRPGLVYFSGQCSTGCPSDANVFQILGLLRVGGGRGLHQVIEIQAGVTGFSNFRQRSDDARLAPEQTVWDPTLTIGYGFGYPLSTNSSVQLVQDYGLLLHRTGTNAPANASRSRQFYVTRLGVRYGL